MTLKLYGAVGTRVADLLRLLICSSEIRGGARLFRGGGCYCDYFVTLFVSEASFEPGCALRTFEAVVSV